MFKDIAHRLFKSTKKADRAKAMDDARNAEAKRAVERADPLDPLVALGRARLTFGGDEGKSPIKVTASDFPLYELVALDDDESSVKVPVVLDAKALDAAKPKHYAMDDVTGYGGTYSGIGAMSEQVASPAILSWYTAQSFIGWQACALIAQHWLVDKACTMSGDDACRNGWVLKTKSGEDLSDEQSQTLKALDIEFKVMENLSQFNRFKNIFGIRVALFDVDSDDPKYYEKPFNIDGVTNGSYKGISQVDPYWMMPMLTSESTADPSSRFFYDPEYWVISGKKYHRSHLIIARGPEPADILKPTYIFGGIPLTQRIYERVYAAERTANEAPLLSMSKRTTAIHVDLESLAANQGEFEQRLAKWIQWRDNNAVKVLGTDETMEQFDISLSDFDSVIMNQFQLVSAIAQTPATELLGTSPKGFNATGEFEMKSYHKHLVSIQSHTYAPLLDRHYLLLAKSNSIEAELSVIWNSVDTPSANELADLNDKKAKTAETYVNMGAVSPDEVRKTLEDDDHSGFNRLNDEPANEEPGMSPDNIAKLQGAEAKQTQGEAQTVSAGAKATAAGGAPAQAATTAKGLAPVAPAPSDEGSKGEQAPMPTRTGPVVPMTAEPDINAPKQGEAERALAGIISNPALAKGLVALASLIGKLDDAITPEGMEPASLSGESPGTVRRSVSPSVRSVHDITPQMEPHKLPKMKMNGLVLAIENARGSVRRGSNLDGTNWEAKMRHHYGFIKGVIGADGDELDCFVGPNLQSDKVFVVNQNDTNTGEFDEHKCMLGFDDGDSAKEGYMASFNPGWSGFDSIHELSMQDFKNWMRDGNCTLPFDSSCIGDKK
jgi:phage-related protein (TIGR01555 family)